MSLEAHDPFANYRPGHLPGRILDGLDGLDGFPADREGDELLGRVLEFGCRYIVFPSQDAAVAWALWVVHCHLIGLLDTTPRLAIIAPEKGCGKTRVLEVTATLVPRPMASVLVTPAVLYRSIDPEKPPTMEIDEVDTLWGKGKENEPLRAIINSGHRRGQDVKRMNMDGPQKTVETFALFAPIAMAGIGTLPPTVMDRSVVVRMRRRAPGDFVARWRARTSEPEGWLIKDDLETWASGITQLALPDDDEEFTDRVADVWEPLFAIADLIGGAWPQLIRRACRALTQVPAEELSIGVRLLKEIRDIWPGDDDFASTTFIVARLHEFDESIWRVEGPLGKKGLTDVRLASMLKPYGVKPLHDEARRQRGYYRYMLEDPWERYLPSANLSNPSKPSEPHTRQTLLREDVPESCKDVDLPGSKARSQTCIHCRLSPDDEEFELVHQWCPSWE